MRVNQSGGGAQLWSASATPLSLDVRLAATGFVGLPLPPGPLPARSDAPCTVLPTRDPPPLGEALRERL